MLASLWMAVAGGALAAAGSPGCTLTGRAAQTICASDTLRAAEARLETQVQAVLDASPRRATWQERVRAFRRALDAGRYEDGAALDADEIASRYEDLLRDIDKELARAASIDRSADVVADIDRRCLARWLTACRVTASGTLHGEDGTRILWQLQAGSSEADGIGMGVMLWDASRAGPPVPIGWTWEGVYYQSPRLTEQGRLWVAGRMVGSGDGNADILFLRSGGAWHDIETESWRDELARRLPKGFGVWHGVDYDFDGLGATTDLWRDSDANCCASGGRANLRFEIEGSSLRLVEVDTDIVERWRKDPPARR